MIKAMEPDPPALEAAALSYRYRGGGEALRRLTFSIPRGAFVGLFGPIGAGKTTLLECCGGLRQITHGALEIDGTSLTGTTRHPLPGVALVSANVDLPGSECLRDLLTWFASTRTEWDDTLAQSLASEFDIPLERPIRVLSRGQQSLVAVLCAIAARPHVLLLDEPFPGLDVAMREAVVRRLLVRVYEDNATVLVASHDVAELEGAADHMLVLERGEIRACGTLDALQERFRRVVVSGDSDGLDRACATATWWNVERSGRVLTGLTTVDSEAGAYSARLEALAGVDHVHIESLALRELYLAVKGSPRDLVMETQS